MGPRKIELECDIYELLQQWCDTYKVADYINSTDERSSFLFPEFVCDNESQKFSTWFRKLTGINEPVITIRHAFISNFLSNKHTGSEIKKWHLIWDILQQHNI